MKNEQDGAKLSGVEQGKRREQRQRTSGIDPKLSRSYSCSVCPQEIKQGAT